MTIPELIHIFFLQYSKIRMQVPDMQDGSCDVSKQILTFLPYNCRLCTDMANLCGSRSHGIIFFHNTSASATYRPKKSYLVSAGDCGGAASRQALTRRHSLHLVKHE